MNKIDADRLLSQADEAIGYWRAVTDLAGWVTTTEGGDCVAYLERRANERYPKRNAGADRLADDLARSA